MGKENFEAKQNVKKTLSSFDWSFIHSEWFSAVIFLGSTLFRSHPDVSAHTENTSRGYYIITARISSIIKWIFFLFSTSILVYARSFSIHTICSSFFRLSHFVRLRFSLRLGLYVKEWEGKRERDGEIIVRYLIFIICWLLWTRVLRSTAHQRCVHVCKIIFYIIQNKWTHLDLPNKTDTEREKTVLQRRWFDARVFTFTIKKKIKLSKQHRKIWQFQLEFCAFAVNMLSV